MLSALLIMTPTDTSAQEYINGVPVTEQDYEDPEYWKYAERQISAQSETDSGYALGRMRMSTFAALPYSDTSSSILTSKKYTHNEAFKDCEILNGIDVSKWQGDINWSKVKNAGIDFVFIRAGNRLAVSGTLTEDSMFKTNIEGALNAGIGHIGVYIYSQAITTSEAIAEANLAIRMVKDYDINMPIVLDMEYYEGGRFNKANLTDAQRTAICEAFCDRVLQSGYTPMIYASKSFFEDDLNAGTLEGKYKIWVAQYPAISSDGTYKCTYSGLYEFWQYSDSGSVDGISGEVDCNFWYYQEPEVTVDSEVIPESVKLSKTSATLLSGASVVLSATVSPSNADKTVTWSSQDPTIAYVSSSGKVVGVSKGVTTIVGTTCNGLTATCKVYVNESLQEYAIADITNCVYTGSNRIRAITVKSKNKIPTKGTVTAASLNIRKGPATSYRLVKTMSKGDKFSILKMITVGSAKWYAVVYTDNSGNSYRGFVSGGSTGTNYQTVTTEYRTLTLNKDYVKEFKNNKAVGIATVNAKGAGSGTYTGTISNTFKIVPSKPVNLKSVSRTKTSVTISWDKTPYASGYYIYRSTSYDGTYKLIATVSSTKLKYTDKGLASGTCYFYKVKAYKKVNGSTLNSGLSVCVETYTTAAKTLTATTTAKTNIYEHAGTSYVKKKAVSKNVALTSVIAQAKDKNNALWYLVSYKVSGKTYKGYIKSTYLSVMMKGKSTANNLNIRTGPGTNYRSIKKINKGTIIKIYSEKNGWYKIMITVNGKATTGYVKKSYIKLM